MPFNSYNCDVAKLRGSGKCHIELAMAKTGNVGLFQHV
jgi:hypothetical protein